MKKPPLSPTLVFPYIPLQPSSHYVGVDNSVTRYRNHFNLLFSKKWEEAYGISLLRMSSPVVARQRNVASYFMISLFVCAPRQFFRFHVILKESMRLVLPRPSFSFSRLYAGSFWPIVHVILWLWATNTLWMRHMEWLKVELYWKAGQSIKLQEQNPIHPVL
jgi:hypothetical protein